MIFGNTLSFKYYRRYFTSYSGISLTLQFAKQEPSAWTQWLCGFWITGFTFSWVPLIQKETVGEKNGI